MTRLQIVHQDATFRIGVARNLMINAWADAPSLEQLRAFGRSARALSREHAGRTALLNVVLGGTPRFPEAVRDEAVKLTRDSGLGRLGVAHLILVGGLAGAATRAFLSTVVLLGRPRVPNKVFGDSRASAEWLAGVLTTGGAAWTADEILALQAEIDPLKR